MHRIDCPTATPDNRFTEGDPTIPVAATTVTADWLNAVQEELAAVIGGAGLTLDKENNAQILQALHKILDIRAPLATLLRAGLMQPDGATATVDEDGLLSVLGGHLLLNSEVWITESGEWVAPEEGWYDILTIDGGDGGVSWMRVNNNVVEVIAGTSGAYRRGLVWLEKGTAVSVVIGAAGKGVIAYSQNGLQSGGKTSFGEYAFSGAAIPGDYYSCNKDYLNRVHLAGRGFGGAPQNSTTPAPFWGG